MGHTSARVKLYSPIFRNRRKSSFCGYGINIFLGTEGHLGETDIRPKGSWKFKTVDGRTLERKIGETLMECMDERATRMVVFAEEEDATILGVDALEGLWLEVDPITERLKNAETLLAP